MKRLNQAFHIEGVNETGQHVHLDASPAVGGENMGMRPMELLLAAAGSCSGIDIINILKKQRQPLEQFKIEVEGERQKDVIPSLFEKIHIHYTFTGNLDEKKVERAIALSLGEYCSVTKMLEKTATITSSFKILSKTESV